MSIKELTPSEYKCGIGCCPGIYEVTPKNSRCVIGACPSIHELKDDYLIIGEQINPSTVGLEEKVGEGEILIKIKKEIIDNKEVYS